MNSIKVCEYSRSRSFHDDLILQDQASGERSQDHWSSGFNVDGVSRCTAHTDKNRYAIDFSGIAYRRFLLCFLTLPDRY